MIRVSAQMRVALDRIIAAEGLLELRWHGVEPSRTWRYASFRIVTLDQNGELRRWLAVDEVDWSDIVAIRVEDAGGRPVDALQLGQRNFIG